MIVGPDGTLWREDSLRGVEHKSIRDFVQNAANQGFLRGRVLDFGCGKQPYRSIIEDAGGEYDGYDEIAFPSNVSGEDIGTELMWDANTWDAILCTQVIQYVPFEYLTTFIDEFKTRLWKDGFLVMTGPTCWQEVESADLHRTTQAGIRVLLEAAGFEVISIAPRAYHPQAGDMSLGWGAIARA